MWPSDTSVSLSEHSSTRITYAPCSCGLTWRHHPAPVEMLSYSKKQTKRNKSGERFKDGKRTNKGNAGRKKRKCAGQIRTLRWRLLDLLLLEDLAFSVSAWNKEGKLGKIIEWKWKGSVTGVEKVTAILNSCYAQAQTLQNNLRSCL